MDGIGSAIAWSLIKPILILFILLFGGFSIYVSVKENIEGKRGNFIESKTIIVPEKRLETDGVKIDTIYIYREK